MAVLCQTSDFSVHADRAQRGAVTGFTLIELLLVLTLASLLLTVVPASFSSMLPYIEQRADIRRFVTVLKQARGMAIRERDEVTVLLDSKKREYRLKGMQKGERISQGVAVEYTPAIGNQVNSPDAVIEIKFFADGSSNGAHILMKSKGSDYRVDVNWLTGKVSYAEAE